MLFVIFCVILDVVLGGCGTLCALCVAVTAWLCDVSICFLHRAGLLTLCESNLVVIVTLFVCTRCGWAGCHFLLRTRLFSDVVS